jgi:hypothetical protein
MLLLEMKEMSRRKFIQSFAAAACVAVTAPLFSGSALAAKGVSKTPLSEVEIADLLFSREEEKVARDVYLALYDMWRHTTFSNISISEQQHMDTMLKKLNAYNIPDPAQAAVGAFTNQDLQKMYIELVATGSKSLIDALKVGCLIEEVDMIDLQKAIDHATHTDLDNSYLNLLEGSKSHLRAFVSALDGQGVIYTPQYISVDLYNAIINV